MKDDRRETGRRPSAVAYRSLRCSVSWAGLTLILLSSSMSAQSEQRPLTVDDTTSFASVRDPQISPDGELVAWTVSTVDVEEDESDSALWVAELDAEGRAALPRRFTSPGTSASSPRFSPDGRRLAFLGSRGDDDEKSQVWVFDLRGGDAQPMTAVERGVSGFEWSLDGMRLVLLVRDPDPEEALPDDDPAKDRPSPHVIDRLQFKRDYAGYLDRRRTHLYVQDLASFFEGRGSGDPRQITSGDFEDGSPAWSPDGTRLAFVSNRTEEPDGNDNDDLFLVSADNTDRGATLVRLTENPGSDRSPVWSPDGKTIAYLRGTRPELIWYQLAELALLDVEQPPSRGGEARPLSAALDRNVRSPRFTPDGRAVRVLLEDSGEVHLGEIPVSGTQPTLAGVERPVSGHLAVSSFSQSDDGRLALLLGKPLVPDAVWVQEEDGAPSDLRQVSTHDDALLSELELGRVESFTVTSTEGAEIEVFVTFPPGFREGFRHPTLLRIHGGPVSQYDASFHLGSQLFAAHGYLVVRANPRGSSGYGEAFQRAIWADWGNRDFQDVMAAVDAVIERGWADPDRLGVGGWSYGGILTNYVITQTDRFAAAVTGASEVLYRSNYGHDHYQLQWERELGLPWETPEAWERISPFNEVAEVTTPTLIMGGALDWNVPILNSEQLYQALKRLGVETQLIVYPGEHHGIRRPSFQRDRWQRQLDWYDRFVKQTPGADG